MIKIYGGCVLKSGDIMTGGLNIKIPTATNPLLITTNTDAPTYNVLSFNNQPGSTSGNIGVTGGGGTDSVLYFDSVGGIHFRVNGLMQVQMNSVGVFFPVQAPTVAAPPAALGGIFFDTTKGKMQVCNDGMTWVNMDGT